MRKCCFDMLDDILEPRESQESRRKRLRALFLDRALFCFFLRKVTVLCSFFNSYFSLRAILHILFFANERKMCEAFTPLLRARNKKKLKDRDESDEKSVSKHVEVLKTEISSFSSSHWPGYF